MSIILDLVNRGNLKLTTTTHSLRADWKPVLNINAAIYGLIYLFQQPNPEDPLNHEAAKCLRDNPVKFKLNVERSLRGMDADGVQFPPAVKAPPAENGALKVR